MPIKYSALDYYNNSNEVQTSSSSTREQKEGIDKKHNMHQQSTSSSLAYINNKNKKQRTIRLSRILIVCLLFASTSVYKLNQHSFLINSFPANNNEGSQPTTTNNQTTVQLVHREWDRMLYGIFTYDSPNEADIRAANRETHLSYFKHYSKNSKGTMRPDTICSLNELLSNSTLAQDPESCRVVYSFVMGGGVGAVGLRNKVDKLKGGRKAVSDVKTRCLWEDPECGGEDVTKWTLDAPNCNISDVLAHELKEHRDITLLSIPENHELGKTDTWFTYMSMLTRQHPELQIGFVGKTDSDTFMRWPIFFRYLGNVAREAINTQPYIYGGWAIHRDVCSAPQYNRVCARTEFIAERFVTGAHVYMNTALAQHVFMDGTSLERKREVWMVGEDLQLGNMAYSDPDIQPYIINHRYGYQAEKINTHCANNPELYRKIYYGIYKEQQKKEKE